MDLQDRTILYYTANAEDPVFEGKIIEDLKKKAGNIPIVSVSRKPIDLGTNICVGEDKPISYTSEWNQVLIGLKAIKTKFVIAAEADCIYPPEYFTFTPPEEDRMYNYTNIYIIWKFKNGIWKKTGYCEGAQMCGRGEWEKRLEAMLPKNWEQLDRQAENRLINVLFRDRGEWTGNPVISFKTRDGVSYRTTFINERLKEIPYWGTINQIREKFL